MEPRIQYAKTSDGVSIAYWTIGQGPALVLMPWIPFNHVELNWERAQGFCERLARKMQLVHYDGRGCGLSDRDVPHSLEGHELDLAAVVDRLGLERFALWAFLTSGPVAIAYAAKHPERVRRLIFWCSFSRATDLLQSQQLQGLLALLERDWELFTETMAHVVYGWSSGDPAREFAAYMRESASHDSVRGAIPVLAEIDVDHLLPEVRCPALVLHRRQMAYPDLGAARHLASRIPDARLVTLEGESSQFGGPGQPGRVTDADTQIILNAVEEFLAQDESASSAALPSGTAIMLFADIADSTALTERLGDKAFREKARELDGALRAVVRENGGTPVEGKLLGDGVLAVFTSARQAIEAALACGQAGTDAGLLL
ncbi:MAG: alpha/beta fold hydrolase, partial [Chloroflexi bacterium]|nr:alpha/beta fold hydrolase [Chloroflexota bacterium]